MQGATHRWSSRSGNGIARVGPPLETKIATLRRRCAIHSLRWLSWRTVPQAPTPNRAVVVFTRAPEAGRVKTRLARELGEATALAAHRELGALVLSAAAGLADCEVVVAYTPADREELVRAWLGGARHYEPQADGDLGTRMLAAITDRFAAGAGRVLLIGTDCPAVGADLLEAAFRELDRADAVLGPSVDGGYYLIGMTSPIPRLFRDIPWSTPMTLSVTLDRAAAAGVTVALLEERRDVDTAADWAAWRATRGAPAGGD